MLTINSLLPNPVGPDAGAEWIKLVNRGTETVDLKNWILKDASGKTFALSGTLPPQSELTLNNSQTKIILNNNTDTVYLYSPSGSLSDSLFYENPAEGEIIMRQAADVSKVNSRSIATMIDQSGAITPARLDFSPLLAGLLIALVMAVLSGYVAKYLGATKDANKF